MADILKNSKVDFYFEKEEKWTAAIKQLRKIVLDTGLAEELKWGCPCYQFDQRNVVLIHVFKEYCALLFFKGALLKDTAGILVQQTKNTQAQRQIRFTNENEIRRQAATIRSYIYQAIEIEKSGLKVKLKKTEAYDIPEEFQTKLAKSTNLKKAFESLTPGRQRGYLLYFSSAKLAKTRAERVEKYIPLIMEGKGLND